MKSVDQFDVDKRYAGDRTTWCRECRNASGRAHKRPFRSALYFEYREWMSKLKDQPCMDCEGWFNPECMDWDHVRGKKSFSMSRVSHGTDKTLILAEIAKCDLVCANCHRIRSRKRLAANGAFNRKKSA